MQITGIDELSLSILDSLDKGTKVKDIPTLFHVSLDQAKRLSRYLKMLGQASKHLEQNEIDKIRMIGLKILYLSPLFRQEDWEGLTEILSFINENTKRDEFPVLIEALQEKRKRISDFQQSINIKLQVLEQRELNLQQVEENMKTIQKQIEKETKFLKKYPKNVRIFLIKHLGLYQDKLVLARRLDSKWQKNLKEKKILAYDNLEYVWLVKDLDGLVADYQKRIIRKTPYPTEWDYDREEKRSQGQYHVPSEPDYRLPNGLAADLRSSIEENEQKMKDIEDERKSIQKEMKELRKTSPQSFIEAVEATNTLSAHELKLHGEMQDKALKWLYNKGYVAASEVTLPNGRRADAIGYNEDGHIVIIEVKVSIADFRQDEKWQTYLDYCDEFYFLPNEKARPVYYQKQYIGAGLLMANKTKISIVEAHTLEHEAKNREKIHFSIANVLSKKYVYGY